MNTDFNPAELKHRDAERIRGYRLLLDFYAGRQWVERSSSRDKQLTFNYARVVLDKLTSYLTGGMRLCLLPDEGHPQAPEKSLLAERALREAAEDNNLEQLDFDTELDCAILGDAAYRVAWDARTGRVRVSAPDAHGLYAWWRPDDARQVWRVAFSYPADVEGGGDKAAVEVWTDAIFEMWRDGHLAERKPNPYGFIPFIIFPNLRRPKCFWGQSDLPALMEPQRELNRALSQLSHILELSGNPIAVLENVERSEDIAVRPGAVWSLPEEARAYLLDLLQGGGINLHLGYIEMLYRTLHDIAESPRAAFGGTGRDLSGVALEMEMQPLLQRIWRKRLIREAVYRQRAEMMLKLIERYRGQDFGHPRIDVTWSAVLPRDVSRVAAGEEAMVQSGIHSRRRAMEELGVSDPEAEFKRWLEERAAILSMNRQYQNRQRPPGE
jgi:hypothetical protein